MLKSAGCEAHLWRCARLYSSVFVLEYINCTAFTWNTEQEKKTKGQAERSAEIRNKDRVQRRVAARLAALNGGHMVKQISGK